MSDIKGKKRTAPPPEKSVGGRSSVPLSSVLRTPVKAPDDWNFWLHKLKVEAWEACALSLNIEPTSMRPSWGFGYWPHKGPFFGDESFPNSATRVEYEKRLKLSIEKLLDSSTFSFKLAEFAAWSLSLGWDDMPPELVEIAQSQKSETEALTPSISVPHKSPRDCRPWETLPEHFNAISGVYMYQQAAREIADAEGWDDSKLEELQSAMADALKTGLLRRRSHKTGLVIAPAPDSLMLVSTADDVLWLVSVDDVNAWLEKQGVVYRWLVNNATPTAKTLTPQSAPDLPSDTIKSKQSLNDEKARQLSTSGMKDWVKSACNIAKEYIDRHKSKDLHPSQKDVCNHIEIEMRTRKLFSKQDKPVSAAYIKRNAIQGKWWKENKP